MVTPNVHANTVRKALNAAEGGISADWHASALAALDALQHQAETAEGLRHDAVTAHHALETAFDAMEAERDAAVRAAEQAHAALREIADTDFTEGCSDGWRALDEAKRIARAALSAHEEVWTHADRMVLGEGGC